MTEAKPFLSSVNLTSHYLVPDYMQMSTVVWNTTVNPSQGAVLNVLRKDLLASGDVKYYAILVSEMDCQSDPETLRKVMNIATDWPIVNSWYDVKDDACQRAYQATPERYSSGLDEDLLGESDYLEIEIGSELCPVTKDVPYCNGPLRAGTKYAIVLRLFTESGYTDNAFVVLETLSEIRLAIIVLLVITVLACGFLAGIIIVLRTRNQNLAKASLRVTTQKTSGAGDILTKNFPEHFDDLSKNNCERMNMEFNIINSGGPAQSSAYTMAKLNDSKNRYTNVLPCT